METSPLICSDREIGIPVMKELIHFWKMPSFKPVRLENKVTANWYVLVYVIHIMSVWREFLFGYLTVLVTKYNCSGNIKFNHQ